MDRKVVAEKLTALRGKKSREMVSEAVGISLSALQMYENGHRIPKDEIKVRLAEYYNKTVQEIFFETQPHKTCGKVNSA